MATQVELEINNPTGLHARPAAAFVRAAAGYRADIRVANVTTNSAEVNAKSLIAILSLGAGAGHRIRLRIEGEDEALAARDLAALVASGLGEASGA